MTTSQVKHRVKPGSELAGWGELRRGAPVYLYCGSDWKRAKVLHAAKRDGKLVGAVVELDRATVAENRNAPRSKLKGVRHITYLPHLRRA